ncbi:hypothetical protein [Streptomyces sp. NPDC048172]|uniref:hypothetical protein n=1 Tax=Streptomyces sp. NPDC048172 TaxID=3365505 RepID=UPI0037116472
MTQAEGTDTEHDIATALKELGLRTVARFCARCERYAPYGLVARLVPAASGPGFEVVACLPCARLLATHPDAPDWLFEDLARLYTAPAWLPSALTPAAER